MARHLLKEGRPGVGLGIEVEMKLFLTVTVQHEAAKLLNVGYISL